jgi:hypothetical protein
MLGEATMRSFAFAIPAEVIAQEYPKTQREGAMPYQEDRILTRNKEAGNFAYYPHLYLLWPFLNKRSVIYGFQVLTQKIILCFLGGQNFAKF